MIYTGIPLIQDSICNSIKLMVSALVLRVTIIASILPPSRDVYECLKKHGHDMTNRVMYGDDAPLFQVTVQSLFSLKKLIAKLPQVDKELETVLIEGKNPLIIYYGFLSFDQYYLNFVIVIVYHCCFSPIQPCCQVLLSKGKMLTVR